MTSALSPVELTTDCTACGLESGVVEVYDARIAACRFGLPASTRCKLCGASAEATFDRPPGGALHEIPANRCPACLGELGPGAFDARACGHCGAKAALVETAGPAAFPDVAAVEDALDAWAARERFPSREALIAATFAAPDAAALHAALQRGDRIEVLADPFANMGVRTTGITGAARTAKPEPRIAPLPATLPARTTLESAAEVPAPAAPEPPPPASAPPRAIVYPLVSVVAADGEIHPEERALIDRFLASEGLPPLREDELRVHHPSSVAHFVPRERREDVVKLMCESASVDGMPDESERRVIRAYATAWNVDDEKLELWLWAYENMNTSLARGLWLKLRRFVLSARWGEPGEIP